MLSKKQKKINKLLNNFFYPETTGVWWNTINPMLEGKTPLAYIKEYGEKGEDYILNQIADLLLRTGR